MPDSATRVVLLARPGDARERLEAALREAGAELVAVADPATTAAGEIAALSPQAVLVALEPAIEEALDAYEPLLSDPGIAVIFDEAELAAQRVGWDAARWVRHLAAKLNRHDDVLPPGREQDSDWQPLPGPLLSQPHREVTERDLDAIADEAQAIADEVPRDGGPGVDGIAGTDADANADTVPMEYAEAAFAYTGEERAAIGSDGGFEEILLEEIALDGDTEQEAPGDGPSGAFGEDAPDAAGLDATGLDEADLDQADLDEIALGGVSLQGIDLDGLDLDGISFEPAADDASQPEAPDDAPAFDILLDDDDGTAGGASQAAADARFNQDLVDLEQRISGLQLADVDSYGHGPERGAVVVEGGLGGPDAVRQLLAAVPAGFPRPLLVRLRLDGGRYDRLVRQMERAAQLPVALAEDDTAVEPGHVYFLPPDIALRRERGQLRFVREDGAGATLPAALPPGDSAVLFLSGSSPQLVDAAMGQAWGGALVAGQSPEGCYDSAAADVVIARGGESGAPARLAERLAERWPPPDRPAGADIEEPES